MRVWHAFFIAVAMVPSGIQAQQAISFSASSGEAAPNRAAASAEPERPYSRLNTWSAFVEFSPNSHHIVLGVSEQRRIVSFAGEYARRLISKSWFEMDYLVQVRPVFLERDPTLAGFRTVGTHRIVTVFPDPVRVISIDHRQFFFQRQGIFVEPLYGSEWTYAGGLKPIGFKWSFASHRKLQPVATFAVGFIASTRDVPVDHSASFNFTFELGAGVEYYLRPKKSLRFDYRVHHSSNSYRGTFDPGIDSNLLQVSYSFGK